MPTRHLTVADRTVLERATFENVNRVSERFTLEDVRSRREFSHYFDAWPGGSDFGLAEVDSEGRILGVAWLTFFDEGEPGYGFVSVDVPELSVWVDGEFRGRGIGADLIRSVIREAQTRHLESLSLSVEEGNPARGLYERLGFRHAGPGFDEGTLLLPLP
ncbi:GNAT family N-acetyltransferase [Leucobacter coleopterorum]|uniref:GNAT family N-acetyltransferase n=1 Tax=Leucobacter coleopterorum TaxID=2714933 RepID=A0ABX6JTJ2_9MICO|nr:GNAT family N-acetyltransferase [Leucobacter coleopterorum]QIM17582.1 GNAT family N-acetyltransferase [Leucobacter coleopterorum]